MNLGAVRIKSRSEEAHLGDENSPRSPEGKPCSSRPDGQKAEPVASTECVLALLPMPRFQKGQKG